MENYTLEDLIVLALPNIREIVFHSDGRIIAKTGGKAPHPKKLYSGKGGTEKEKMRNAVLKLIKDNIPTIYYE